MDEHPFFVRTFPSALGTVGEVLSDALDALSENDWIEPEQEFYARLCLEEALVNAVVHGNGGDPERVVRLTMSADGDTCFIRVYDEGKGFSPDALGVPAPERMNGRGICLIRHCMGDVKYNRETHCLEMRMQRKALCKGG